MKDDILNKTIKSLESSLEKVPDNEQMMINLAELYLKNDQMGPKTLRLLERLSELAPENLRIHRALSICYLIQQPAELANNVKDLSSFDVQALSETRNRLDALKSQHEHSADLHKALGDVNLFLRHPEEAVSDYKTALDLEYEDLTLILKSFTLAHRSYKLPPSALCFFASLYDKGGFQDRAADIYRGILKDGVADKSATEWLTRYYEGLVAAEADMDVPPDHKIELLNLYVNNNKIKEAIELSHSINIPEMKDFTIIKKIARELIDSEDYRQAFDFLSRIPLDTENKALINEITLRLERHGELDTAVYLLQFINTHDLVIMEAQEREDKELKVHTELGLAELHYKNKKWESALEKYISILNMGYEDWSFIMNRIDHILNQMEKPSLAHYLYAADVQYNHNNWTQAADYLTQALEMYPGLPEIQLKLNDVYSQMLAASPNSPEVRLRYADLCYSMGNIQKAIADYIEVSQNPDFYLIAMRRLARSYETINEYSQALEKYLALNDIGPDDFPSLLHLYEKMMEHNMLKEALETLRLIHSRDPEYGDIETRIQEIETRIQNQDQALFLDPKMRELIGDHAIGRYKYISKVGSGGMGVVHKVFDIRNNCEVAMKILREGLSGSSKAIDRFFREARTAATLNHKNIVKIFDYNISNVYGQSYITMSFVDGPSLRDIIEERFSESLEISNHEIGQTLYYMSQLCEALECTHNRGIIHRDIKPDNIMIDKGDKVKITDFGIVHVEEASFTPTGALIGTPRYMSPEQVRGGKIDGRSDIYSVGIIMYELLVGSPPFISGDIAYQQVNVEPTPPRDICPAIPESVNAIIRKCLAKKPEERFQTAPDLKKTIDEALSEIGGYMPADNGASSNNAPCNEEPIVDSGSDNPDEIPGERTG